MRREIGALLGVALVINATIGTGIFKTPAKVARLSGSLTAALVTWGVGGIIALAGALSLAELAAALPRTGGIYEFLRRTYGPQVAFLFGWTKLTLLIPSAVGSFAKLGAESLASLAGWAPDAKRDSRVALIFLVACGAANLFGVRTSARQQAAITFLKYLGVALLAVLGLCLVPSGSVPPPAKPEHFLTVPTLAGCAAALVSVMWAYDGWADLSSLSGEVRDPARSLPRALFAGTAAIVVVYLAANFGYARALGIDGLRNSTTGDHMAAANLASLTVGVYGRRLLSLIILFSCVGGCMSSILTGTRVFVPLATDGLFVGWLGEVSPKTAVPARAVVVATVLGGIYVSVRSFEQLTEAFVVGYFPFYLLAVAAIFVLRIREPELERPFRVPGFPFTPAIFISGALLLLWGAAADVDRTALIAFAVMALGIPVGWAWSLLRGETRAA
jgi:APA family basic amino acid/polyamine antiporter